MRLTLKFLVVGLLCAGIASASSSVELGGVPVELTTSDHWTIHGIYQKPGSGGKTVVLFHGRGRTKEEWSPLARALERRGYGYLAVDLRGHGASVIGPDGEPASWRTFKVTRDQNDYMNMALDVQAAVEYLKAREIPEDSVVFVGDDIGGIAALKYAAAHPQLSMVAMISPAMQYQDIPSVNAVRAYKDRPILFVYSDTDRRTSREAPLLYEFAKRAAGERNATLMPIADVPSQQLVTHGSTIRAIVDWIANPIKPAITEVPSGKN